MTHAYRWSCVSRDVAWSPRDGAQFVSFQGKLFLLGGWNQYAGDRADLAGAGTGSFESEVCSEVWCSDDGVDWSLAATAPWSGRHMHGAVVHEGHIWIVGAENGTPDDVWKSKDGVHWELVAATVPWQEAGLAQQPDKTDQGPEKGHRRAEAIPRRRTGDKEHREDPGPVKESDKTDQGSEEVAGAERS